MGVHCDITTSMECVEPLSLPRLLPASRGEGIGKSHGGGSKMRPKLSDTRIFI